MGVEDEEPVPYPAPSESVTGGFVDALTMFGRTSLGSRLGVWAFNQYSDVVYEESPDYPQSLADAWHETPVDRDATMRNDVLMYEDGEDEDILRKIPDTTKMPGAEIIDHADYIVSQERAHGRPTIEAPVRYWGKASFNFTDEGFLEDTPSNIFADAEPVEGSFRYVVLENAERGEGQGELRANGFYDIDSEGALLHDFHMAFEYSPEDIAEVLGG